MIRAGREAFCKSYIPILSYDSFNIDDTIMQILYYINYICVHDEAKNELVVYL